MAYENKIIDDAEYYFCIENIKIENISKLVNVPETTLERWRKVYDWDKQKELCNFNYVEFEKLYLVEIKKILLKVKKGEVDLLNPSVADSLAKHFAIMNKINPTKKNYGLILSFISKVDEYFQDKDPELRERLLVHWDGIKEILKEYIEKQK